MKIDLLDTEKLIEVNKLQEVTSTTLFSNKTTYDPDGLLSSEIFGLSKGDRRNTFAYIDLKIHFIHPHIYAKVLKSIYKNIIYLVAGQRRFSIRDGELVEDENGWTGIVNLYDHWDEIDWSKRKSDNTVSKKLLMNTTRDQIFITKQIVCPPAYRDVMLSGTVDSSDHVEELNNYYLKLIRLVSTLGEGGLMARNRYKTQANIQDTLVQIMNYFKMQISRKQGLIRKNLIGKSIDYGTRSVISAPTYNTERFEDSMVDMEHTALPIYQCCANFRPFIDAWLLNFFTRDIINNSNSFVYYDYENNKDITATLKDPEIQFSEKNIRKLVNDYCLNPDNRFKVLTVDVNVPTASGDKVGKANIVLKGEILNEDGTRVKFDRPLTITDILYLACVDVCEKRHVMVSRYPVGTDKGIYFNKIRVQSTKTHVHVLFNGKDYPYYPDIKLGTKPDHVGVQFIDTLVMSNAHLDGMGADYDGDQVSCRGIWSDEANLEAEEIMNRKMSALNITGTNAKKVSREVFNALFELTKAGEGGKTIAVEIQQDLLKLTPQMITRTYLTDLFADTVDNSAGKNNAGKRKSRFNTWDKMNIPAGYFYKGQPQTDTTIGRFIVNKFVFEGSGVIGVTKYVDKVFNKKVIEGYDDEIGTYYMEDKIDRNMFNNYIDRRDTLGYWCNGMLAHTISQRMLKPLPSVNKKKEELCKKYERELADGNVDVMTKIADELIAFAKEELKGDPGMDLYDSGDLDFDNNYRNNAILKGAIVNKITGEYDFVSTSFMDGIAIKDIPAHANSILASQYPCSIATAYAGYLGKKLLALLQMMEVDEPGTDCGVKNLIPITITNQNKDNLVYTYIMKGDQLEMLTKSNVSSYVGKTVKMRSPMSCKHGKICSKCAGELFYYLDAKHAGLFGVQISHADLNLALKAKHNSVVNLHTLNPDTIIEDLD